MAAAHDEARVDARVERRPADAQQDVAHNAGMGRVARVAAGRRRGVAPGDERRLAPGRRRRVDDHARDARAVGAGQHLDRGEAAGGRRERRVAQAQEHLAAER